MKSQDITLESLQSIVNGLISEDIKDVKLAYTMLKNINPNPFTNPILFTLKNNIEFVDVWILYNKLLQSLKWQAYPPHYRKNMKVLSIEGNTSLSNRGIMIYRWYEKV